MCSTRVPDFVLPVSQPYDAHVQHVLLLLRSGGHWLLRPQGDERQPGVGSGEPRSQHVPLCCFVVECQNFIWLLNVRVEQYA